MANKLTIPRKNARPKTADLNQEDADINWRAIEQWANSLTFPSGGVTAGQMGAFAYAPSAVSPTAILPITPAGALNLWGINDGTGDTDMQGSDLWVGKFGGTPSHVVLYPRLYAPNFSGGPLVFSAINIQACDITMTNYFRAAAPGPFNLTSGATHSTVQADYTLTTVVGPELSLDTSGIHTNTTGVFFGSITIKIDYPACTFA